MAYRRRTRRRRAGRKRRFSRTRRLAPKPIEQTAALTGVLKVAADGSGVKHNAVTIDIDPLTGAGQDIALVRANGSYQASVFHGASGEDMEMVLALCTPDRRAQTDFTDAQLAAFNPFEKPDPLADARARGFNIVRLHRLANAHPAGAANMVYTFNRRFTRRFRRVMNPNRSAALVVWVQGKGTLALAFDAGLRYVRND